MVEILAMATVIAPVTSGFVQAVKKAIRINDNLLPILAIILGAILGGCAFFLDAEIGLRIWAGGVSGLAATGLFELGKNVKEEIDNG